MSNEEFRRELKNVFDDVSGSPSSNLPGRVRSAIANPPEVRRPYWLAAVAACVIAVLIVSVLYLAGPLKPPSTVGVVEATPTPVATPSATSLATPSPSPSGPPYVCASGTGASHPSAPLTAYVDDMRTGTHSGYDRLTITFQAGGPTDRVQLKTQSGTKFMTSPLGATVTLKGSNGIQVSMHSADIHTAYSGSRDIVTGYATLAEVRITQDFEGYVWIALGINGPSCYRAFWLSSPDRLVIDIQAS